MHHSTSLKIELQQLIGRAMIDVAFRAELIRDPARIAEHEGISLTAEDIEMLSRLNQPDYIVNQGITINADNIALQRLIGRATINPAFRAELIQDPIRVAEREGLSLTAEDVEILGRLDQLTNNPIVNQDSAMEAPWN